MVKKTVKKTEKDLWVEMSIREISTQAHFAKIAYGNLHPKAIRGTDAVFSSIHSFLSHCANISKMLEAKDDKKSPTTIGTVLRIPKSSAIHNRTFRNNLEHYDERLKQWIRNKGPNAFVCTYNIGPKTMIQVPNAIFVSHYDPENNTYTFVDEDFNLGILFDEVIKIKTRADKWVEEILSGKVSLPYI